MVGREAPVGVAGAIWVVKAASLCRSPKETSTPNRGRTVAAASFRLPTDPLLD